MSYINSREKADADVENALDSRLAREREWKKKSSTVVKADDLYKKARHKLNLDVTPLLNNIITRIELINGKLSERNIFKEKAMLIQIPFNNS